MIKYALNCDRDHEFEGWFSSAKSFDEEQAEGRLSCPHCGSTNISKALMAPNVRSAKGRAEEASFTDPQQVDVAATPASPEAADKMREAMNQIRDYVEKNADYVGTEFAEEARKIHFEEEDARDIYGEATPAEVQELHDEGIDIFALPPSRKKTN